MKLEVGKTYITRDKNFKVKIIHEFKRKKYPVLGIMESADDLEEMDTWDPSGAYSMCSNHPYDLLEEVETANHDPNQPSLFEDEEHA